MTGVQPESEAEELELNDGDLREQRLMGGEIRKRREALGLTRTELAEKLGEPYTEELIAEYESGDTSMEATRVLELMKVLCISGETINPKRLLADTFVRNGYSTLTAERRKAVDLLTEVLVKDQRETSRRDSTD